MRVFLKKFNFIAAPLIPACVGFITGLVVCYFSASFFSLYFCLFWFFTTTLFVYHFRQSLFTHSGLLYNVLQFYIFMFCGGVVFRTNDLLVTTLVAEMTNRSCDLVTRVDEISQNTEGTYPHRAILDLGQTSAAFYNRHLILFLRNNFLHIGDFVVLQEFTLLPASHSDLRQGCLGLVFYQPGKTRLWKYKALALSLKQRLNLFKRKLCTSILNKMSNLTKSFYGLIFLGYRQKEVPTNLREPFQVWGISHYLARSGLHLTIFSYFCFFVFMLLPVSVGWRYFVAICISFVYYLLTYVSVSFLRAELMFLMGMFAKIFLRRGHQLHFLVLTCMLILLFNPYQLFALDFQLSFSLVFALLIVSNLLSWEKRLSKY